MNFIELQQFIDNANIPSVNRNPQTFLGISKFPHYENVWSNIYAFFLNVDEEHNFRDLFISSLLELLSERDSSFFKGSFKVKTEYPTEKKGRIDILLFNDYETIIIENKVNHYLKNDLDDYWESITTSHKRGVVISVKKMKKSEILNSNFINITHLEFISKVIFHLPSFIENSDDKYVVFLKDFYQNIINTTKPMDFNLLKFYSKNQSEINKLSEIKEICMSHIISEVENSSDDINAKLEVYKRGTNRFRHLICPDEKNLMITIVFESLFKEEQLLQIVIEFQNELLDRIRKNVEAVLNLNYTSEERNIIDKNFFKIRGNWVHFATLTLQPSESEILELGNYISNTINESPILSIYKKLEAGLNSN